MVFARTAALFSPWLWLGVAAMSVAAGEQRPLHATVDEDGVQRVQITGGSYYFEPSHVVVRVGVPVELTLEYGSGFVSHDFRLDAPEAGIDVQEELSHRPVTVTFTPTRTGTFTYYCTMDPPLIGSHRDRGMEGILEVVDDREG